MTDIRLAAMSDYLLGLYARSAAADATAYSSFALDGMRDLLGADKAWWGIACWGRQTIAPSGPRLLGSFRSELPPSWEPAWERVKQDDCLARTIARSKGQAVSLRSGSLPGKLIQLAEAFDIHETLCVSAELPDHDALMFLALYRGDRRDLYRPEDKHLVELLIPHLRATWHQNRRALLQADEHDDDIEVLKAFVTNDGQLVQCDHEFATAVSRQWPNWRGSLLPLSLRDAIDRARVTPGCWIGPDAWRVRTTEAGLLTLVEWRERTKLDRLTPRELQVARFYADGATHKDIARLTGLTPSTVRHYLKEAYSKLDIDNKAKLAGLLCHQGRSGGKRRQ